MNDQQRVEAERITAERIAANPAVLELAELLGMTRDDYVEAVAEGLPPTVVTTT